MSRAIEMNIRQIALLLTPRVAREPCDGGGGECGAEGVTVRIKQLTQRNPEYGVDMRTRRLGR